MPDLSSTQVNNAINKAKANGATSNPYGVPSNAGYSSPSTYSVGNLGGAPAVGSVAGSPTGGGSSNNGFYYTSQPIPGYTYGAGNVGNSYTNPARTPANVSPVLVGESRSGVKQTTAPDLNSIANNMYKPNVNAQGPSFNLNPYSVQGANVNIDTGTPEMDSRFNDIYNKKAALTMSDFGIPDSVKQQMKVQAAQEVNSAYDQQREAAKRMLSRAGILNDSAQTQLAEQMDQARNADVFKRYSDIDVNSAIQANQQRLQNLNDLLGAGQDASQLGEQGRQFNIGNRLNQAQLNEQGRQANLSSLYNQQNLGEQGRQFNVGAQMDLGRMGLDTQKFLEDSRMNRASLNESIAEYLQNLDLERLKASQGLMGTAPDLSEARRKELYGAFQSL